MTIYIKSRRLASSIVAPSILAAALFAVAGCDTLGLPDLTRHDEVPAAVKDQPRLVESAPVPAAQESWPRLGDVPAKPDSFSPAAVSTHYMDELDYDRAEAEAARNLAQDQSVPGTDAGGLTPPQFSR